MDFARNRAGRSQQYWLDASSYWNRLGANELEMACKMAASDFPSSSSLVNNMSGDLASFSHAVSFACNGRRLFVTHDGSLGIGPRAFTAG
jgi:hypothetical protein